VIGRAAGLVWCSGLLLACAGLLLACAGPPAPDATRTASVRMALEADPWGCAIPADANCSDFCVTTAGASLYREGESLPLGPGLTAKCGEGLSFSSLPAGHRVFATAFLAQGPTRMWEGVSEPLTVAADAVTELTTELWPVDPPVLTAISPEPALPGETLTLSGSEFIRSAGPVWVQWDCTGGAQATAVGPSSAEVVLPADTLATELRLSRCSVTSNSLPIRIATAPTERPLSPPGCDGFMVQATASDGAEALLAAACADGSGQLLRFAPDGCSYGESVALPGTPVAVSAGTSVRVATDQALLRIENGVASDSGFGLPVHALTATTSDVWLIAGDGDGALWREADDTFSKVPGIVAGALRDVAAADGEVVIAGDGRLVILTIEGGNSDAPANPACDPVAVDARDGAAYVAVACVDGVIGYDLVARDWTAHIPESVGVDIALDAVGDAAFVLAGGSLGAASLATGRVFGPWLVNREPPLLHVGGHRLLTGSLALLGGWAGTDLCDGGGR
jgi:hypothetical protein